MASISRDATVDMTASICVSRLQISGGTKLVMLTDVNWSCQSTPLFAYAYSPKVQ